MIQFFKINDPLKIGYFLILGIAIRLFALLWLIPVLEPEFQWMLLGDKLGDGLLLYKDVEDHTAVLSGLTFWFIHELFGRSHIAYQLITTFIICGQAVIFNMIVNKSDLLKDHSYVPGLIYIIISSICIDFYILSPALLGLTFALFAFSRFFYVLKNGNSDDIAFKLGINIGIAFLFYKPYILLLILLIFDLLLYSNTKVKRYIIVLFSFLFPSLLIMCFYYWKLSFNDFINHFFINSFSVSKFSYLELKSVLVIFTIPVASAVLGFFKAVNGLGYINYQTKCHYVLLHWLVVGIFSAFFSTEFSTLSFIPILPSLVLFSCIFFTDWRRNWLGELAFLAFCFSSLFTSFGFKNEIWKEYDLLDYNSLVLSENHLPGGAKILVLSEEVNYYHNNEIATNLLNWRINKEYFENLDDYNNVTYIYDRLNEDLPDVIIDPEDYCKKLFGYLPSLRNHYERSGDMYFVKD